MTRVRQRLALFILLVTAAGAARADVDMTGFWSVNAFSSGECMLFTQVGSVLTARFCTPDGPDFSGTIDPMTGAFSLSRTPSCPSYSVYCDAIDGTTAPDGQTFSGTLNCQILRIDGCTTFTGPLSGSRVVCGDGSVMPQAGEQCDDGNTLAGDCCSPTCLVEPNGTACDDGNPGTTGDVCLGGICADLGDEFQVNTYTTSGQSAPSLSCDGNGAFVVVWHGVFAADGISGQRYDSAGAPVGTEFQIATDSPRYPAVSTNAAGEFVVVWTRPLAPPSGVPLGVFARHYDSAGAPVGSELQVHTMATAAWVRPEVSLNPTGAFVVVWTGADDGSAEGVFGQRYDSMGARVGSEFRVNSVTLGIQLRPAVHLDDGGNFVVAWDGDTDGDSRGVFARRYDSSGAPIALEFVVNTATAALQGPADVAGDAAGRFLVVWADGLAVRARRFTSGGAAVGSEILVHPSSGSGTVTRPAVATGPTGSFVVTWQGSDPLDVFARKYLSDGSADGTEFQVNVFTTFIQSAPDVCHGPGDDFVITWESENEDGDSIGVFGRRFAPPSATPIDHYKCYQGTDLKNPLFIATTAATADQLTTEPVVARKLKYVCTPVDKNGEGIHDSAAHLACYQVTAALLTPRPKLEISTQFQSSRFEVKRPKLLCLPSTTTIMP